MKDRASFALLATLCIAVLCSDALCGKDKKQEEAAALLAKAREISDIRAEGSPPFRLRVSVRFNHLIGGTTVVGTYEEAWGSANK